MSSAKLIDVLTRHQIYLEGVKAYQAQQFNDVLLELQTELRKQFSRLRYTTLDEMTKSTLRSFITSLRESQWRIYNGYTTVLLRMLRDFMEADVDVTTELFSEVTGQTLEEAQNSNEFAALLGLLAASGTDKGNDRLWSTILNSPIPANGLLLLPFITGFTNSAVNAIENIIRKGVANRWTVNETLEAILGTKGANFRDGALNGVNNQAGAVIATVLQHISATTQGGVGSIFYRKYRWVSIIDNATTEICRGRNGKIYEYGKGPLPPAHIRCRSKVVPVSVESGDDDGPRSYYAWLRTQPAEVQNDILGKAKAEGVRNGSAKATDYPSFNEAKPLTIAQFKAKLRLMLTNG